MVKKKPLARRLHNSAVCEEGGGEGEGGEVREVGSGWVTAVAAFPNTDLVASGENPVLVTKCKCASFNHAVRVTRCACFARQYVVSATGSSNGHVALWKCGGDFRSLDCRFTVEVVRKIGDESEFSSLSILSISLY